MLRHPARFTVRCEVQRGVRSSVPAPFFEELPRENPEGILIFPCLFSLWASRVVTCPVEQCTMVPMKILIADDDQAVRESLRRSLIFNGYTVILATDGQEALDLIKAERPDLAIVDVMMPRRDGLEVCRELRSHGDDLPILLLTARDSVSERVAGLDAGADDYLPKPFALEELLARTRSLFRRATRPSISAGSSAEPLRFEDLTLNPETREVARGSNPISLTRTEFALLELLMAHPRKVLSRNTILEEVWGHDFPTSGNALEVYIGYLRRKTEEHNSDRLIHTVRGVGYVLRETAP